MKIRIWLRNQNIHSFLIPKNPCGRICDSLTAVISDRKKLPFLSPAHREKIAVAFVHTGLKGKAEKQWNISNEIFVDSNSGVGWDQIIEHQTL